MVLLFTVFVAGCGGDDKKESAPDAALGAAGAVGSLADASGGTGGSIAGGGAGGGLPGAGGAGGTAAGAADASGGGGGAQVVTWDAALAEDGAAAPDAGGDAPRAPDSATPDAPPAASDAGAPLDSALADASPPADGGGGSMCVQAGSSCKTGACCAGTTCVEFPDGDFCSANCAVGMDCVSGCCAPLKSGGAVCAPSSFCATCKKAGEENCQSNADCCAGALCISELSGGVVTRRVCKDKCTANNGCVSGCCAPIIDSTDRVCSAQNFCGGTAVPPTSGGRASGTYAVTVSREESDIYRVQGERTWIKTRFCFEFVYFDRATLVWGGKFAVGNKITFSSGRSCDVEDVLVGQ
jgi:hypothetical protein